LFSHRYTPADFNEQLTEVSIKEGGRAKVTGFPTLGLPWWEPPSVFLVAFPLKGPFSKGART
jgi:hypothetical protein